MLKLKKVIRQIRMKNKDNNEIRFSDYDILQALNECIRYINTSLSLQNCDFLEKTKRYNQNDINSAIERYNSSVSSEFDKKEYVDFSVTGVDLPEDFISLLNISRCSDGYVMSPSNSIDNIKTANRYKVSGGKIYCYVSDFVLLYIASIAEISSQDIASDSAVIDLPPTFLDAVVKITSLILNQSESDVLMQETQRILNGLIVGRRYGNIKSRMPFIV